MAEPLKHRYNKAFITSLSDALLKYHPAFDSTQFQKLIFNAAWEAKELKQRMRHITESLYQCLPDYQQAIPILKAASSQFTNTFEHMFFPDYVECYGLNEYGLSIDALEHFTKYSSSEFAVRPFIIKYPEKMMQQMKHWANHESEHVRRLAAEGCRPRLPWAMQLPMFIKDPTPVLGVLDTLQHDSSLYVRRSVANNLNDIAKDHPQIVLNIAKAWLGKNKDTDWLIKHACRTLLKQGNTEALALFGFTPAKHIRIQDFQVSTQVNWAGKLTFPPHSAAINL
ncbi:MAG: DNA alkylation repair protein [Ghiorsea sp.]|nr:DNA alkylation repair protein [Ghiorsea sp.]